MTCCTHDCDEGRACTLQQGDGGKAIQGGFAVSIAVPLAEVPDEPIATPEQAEGWTAWALYGLAILTCVLSFLAVARFVEALS